MDWDEVEARFGFPGGVQGITDSVVGPGSSDLRRLHVKRIATPVCRRPGNGFDSVDTAVIRFLSPWVWPHSHCTLQTERPSSIPTYKQILYRLLVVIPKNHSPTLFIFFLPFLFRPFFLTAPRFCIRMLPFHPHHRTRGFDQDVPS